MDLDGVVADFTNGWISLYNADFGASISASDVTAWRSFVDLTHFTSAGEFWAWAQRGGGPSMFRGFGTHEGAIESLWRLDGEHEIVVLTTKPSWAIHDTYAWIADQRLPTREIHIIAQKWMVECDVYLDDNPYQLRDLAHNRPDSTVCRFVRPWNEPREGLVDIHDWDEFEAVVYDLSHR